MRLRSWVSRALLACQRRLLKLTRRKTRHCPAQDDVQVERRSDVEEDRSKTRRCRPVVKANSLLQSFGALESKPSWARSVAWHDCMTSKTTSPTVSHAAPFPARRAAPRRLAFSVEAFRPSPPRALTKS